MTNPNNLRKAIAEVLGAELPWLEEDLLEFAEKIELAIRSLIEKKVEGLKKEGASHYDLCLLSNEDRAEEEGKVEGYNDAITQVQDLIKEI